MLNTKLFQLTIHLSPEDMKAVRNFLLSKHKKSANIFKLFDYIDQHHPDFEENKVKLTNEKVYARVFGRGQAYNKGNMQALASNLFKEIKFFLVTQEIEEDKILYDVLLSRVFKKRGMDELFKKHNDSSQKAILKAPVLEHHHYHALAQLSHDATFHRDTPKLNTDYDQQLAQAEEYLDMRYLLDKLKIICERMAMKEIIQSEDNLGLIVVDFQEIKKNIQNNALASLYFMVIEMYDKDNVEAYRLLKEKILANKLSLSPEVTYNLCGFLINFCSKKYKSNKTHYTSELFELYEYLIDNNLLLEDNYIYENHFIYSIIVAVGIEAYPAAQRNLKLYKKLKPRYQASGKALGNAILYFAQKKYEDVITHLQQTKMKDISYKLTARSLLMRSYYELGEWIVLKDYIKAGRRFIKREKTIAPTTGKANLNFYNFVAELIKHNEKPSPNSPTILREKLQQHTTMIHIEWCTQKIKELVDKDG